MRPKVRNISANPEVMLLVDEYSESWEQPAWVWIRGTAALLEAGATYAAADYLVELLPAYIELGWLLGSWQRRIQET